MVTLMVKSSSLAWLKPFTPGTLSATVTLGKVMTPLFPWAIYFSR